MPEPIESPPNPAAPSVHPCRVEPVISPLLTGCPAFAAHDAEIVAPLIDEIGCIALTCAVIAREGGRSSKRGRAYSVTDLRSGDIDHPNSD